MKKKILFIKTEHSLPSNELNKIAEQLREIKGLEDYQFVLTQGLELLSGKELIEYFETILKELKK